mmetsp:Transcript_16806/g.27797  ORF Transcript_16806/g.27797 Transcript_16806/m.27797 type:complete len:264 (-) Transcript_16806:686-1477(-)|eukprot:CAMPEP_0184651684 /NCGR_PEP_ID=MMETSP0308-20130426/9336_1 /TAXON_ID=38269 /ORGANISM="Gloeochaete witrockiana, Strain SAG 46.84" /LENGTH=263 /DNA_ID=CAMNT_0027086085 /DNA_START=40 /DNA_END=831 /DNA_ORIENTATION=-
MAENDAIQQFCLLAKNSRGRACVAIIQQAISTPGLFVFGELLDQPSIQELDSNPETKPAYSLLRLFAHGTFAEYKANMHLFPPLTPQQIIKLKQLTIVSLSAEHKILPYDVLLQQIDISNVRELEDLIIDSIYQGMIRGKLDQRYKHLEVQFAIGRDLRPGQMEQIMATIQTWVETSETLLRTIEERVRYAASSQEAAKKHKQDFEAHVDSLKKSLKESGPENEYSRHDEGSDYMEEQHTRPQKSSRSKQKHAMLMDHRERRR